MPLNDIQAASWVEKTPRVRGGEARARHTRHTVAGLARWRKPAAGRRGNPAPSCAWT